MKQKITVEAEVNAPINKVWEMYTKPEHIVNWNHASDDWCSPHAENNLVPGGKFLYRMESKDGKYGFDFGGTYDEVIENELIRYTLGDAREVKVSLQRENESTKVTVEFDAETENSIERQKQGWQAILDNFKKYAERK
jgi:uncharacterized protein YndB with AHSA1/START domain